MLFSVVDDSFMEPVLDLAQQGSQGMSASKNNTSILFIASDHSGAQ